MTTVAAAVASAGPAVASAGPAVASAGPAVGSAGPALGPPGGAASGPRPTYLPDGVAAALRLLAVPASVLAGGGPADGVAGRCADAPTERVGWEVSEAAWAVVSASLADRRVGDLPSAWVEEELQVLEAVERVKAWADFQGLAALRRLREAVLEQVWHGNDEIAAMGGREMPAHVVQAEADTAAVDEVMLATGLPQWQVAQRLSLARDGDGRASVLLAALADGQVSLDRAVRIHRDTERLSAAEVHAISARLLAPNPDGSIRSHRSFTKQLRRQVVLHTPDAARARADAVADRAAYAVLDGDGTGTLTVVGEASRVTAAIERVEDLARRLRAEGDSRTLAQLRSDIALDLVLYGWARSADVPQPCAPTFVGQAPAAHVTLVVSLATLLGLDAAVAEIPGYGFITGQHARQLATAAGSVWRRLVTDPVTGTALELSTTRYRPTPAMAAMVAALDGMCSAPGCTTPAHRCDIDHQRPWPHGPTTVSNLRLRHRRHHNHKTRGTWTATTDPDGAVTWTTAARRRYTSPRHDYHDPHTSPVTDTEIAAAAAHDPPPF